MTSLEWRKQESRDITNGGMVGEQQVVAGPASSPFHEKHPDLGDVEFSC